MDKKNSSESLIACVDTKVRKEDIQRVLAYQNVEPMDLDEEEDFAV